MEKKAAVISTRGICIPGSLSKILKQMELPEEGMDGGVEEKKYGIQLYVIPWVCADQYG